MLRKIRNYFLYCGIEKDEYNALKKDAYVSNFRTWRVLHFLMAAFFGLCFIGSYFSPLMADNKMFYLAGLIYSLISIICFFVLKEDALVPQLLIYVSISWMLLFGCLVSANKPDAQATSFIAFLLITPMFMIDKPFFMAIELSAAAFVYLVWMHGVKTPEAWSVDFVNVILYTAVGIFLNIIANSLRIKEFILTREIRFQKDHDELTGLKNKSALTRAINNFLKDENSDKGILYMLDVDKFKSINDTYGHDIGDRVIRHIGYFLAEKFKDDEIVGRFGGDEFIIFIRNNDDVEHACTMADEVAKGVAQNVHVPGKGGKVNVSVGIAVYSGVEKTYSELFKKADFAMYKAKDDPSKSFYVYGES